MAASNKEIYAELLVRLTEAEEKHPLFAEGSYQALGYIGEEYSEVVRALTKKEGDARFRDELFDLIVVAWRTLRGDHEAACKPSCEPCGKEGWEWFFNRNMTRL